MYLNSTHITYRIFCVSIATVVTRSATKLGYTHIAYLFMRYFFIRFDWNFIRIDAVYSLNCVFVIRINKEIYQGRQSTDNVTLRHVRVTTVVIEKQ